MNLSKRSDISTEANASARSEERKHKIDNVVRNLALELRSKIQRKLDDGRSKCLVRFHNCTPYRITPYWIDFRGLPIQYGTLPRGASINIDTYVLHLWYFKAEVSNVDSLKTIKILALPEETLQLNRVTSELHPHNLHSFLSNDIDAGRQSLQDTILSANNILICSLCKLLLQRKSLVPSKIPCPHFTGEARYSVSDFNGQLSGSYNSTYIYSCSENSHHKNHQVERRNIYLVEPFLSLRERCFLTLRERVPHRDITDLDLPVSLQIDYLGFLTTLTKLNEGNTDS